MGGSLADSYISVRFWPTRYVDAHRGRFGVEPICGALGVSASAYYERRRGRRSKRSHRDELLLERIKEIHAANYYAYGYRHMGKALQRAGEPAARCTVQRLMAELIADRVWRSRSQLELAVVEYVGWFNQVRLHESLGDLPPAEFEALYAAQREPTRAIR